MLRARFALIALVLISLQAAPAGAGLSCFVRNFSAQISSATSYPGCSEFIATHSKAELDTLIKEDPDFAQQIKDHRVSFQKGRWLLKMLPRYTGEESTPLPGTKSSNFTTYFSPFDAAAYRAKVQNGMLVNLHGQTFAEGKAEFVIDDRGVTYIFNSPTTRGIQGNAVVHHSSFTRGGSIQGGGWIFFDKSGQVVKITTRSGHYQPSSLFLYQAAAILRQLGVSLRSAKLIPSFF